MPSATFRGKTPTSAYRSDRGGFLVVNARLLETESGDSVVAKRVEMRKIPINRQ